MMKSCGILVVFLLLVAVSTELKIMHADAQTICNMSGQGLMSCRPAVTPPNPSPPSSLCCNALKHGDINCLCSFKNSNWLPSLGIDPDLAVKLPEKCKLPPANC